MLSASHSTKREGGMGHKVTEVPKEAAHDSSVHSSKRMRACVAAGVVPILLLRATISMMSPEHQVCPLATATTRSPAANGGCSEPPTSAAAATQSSIV